MTAVNLRGCIVAMALLSVCLATQASAGIVLDPENITWTTVGTDVEFHLRFYNPDQVTSGTVTGELRAVEFGVFLPEEEELLVGTFDIPPIEPESFFDVFFIVPMSQLPPSAAETMETMLGSGPSVLNGDCNPDDHWDGNVDVWWAGPGGAGQVLAHIGTIKVCPGGGRSFIHVVTGPCATPIAWAIVGLCAGFNATLVNEDLTPANNPVPGGWSGHIATTAVVGVAAGTVCCFNVNFTCGVQTATINLCATACTCQPTAVEPTNWGAIKALYR